MDTFDDEAIDNSFPEKDIPRNEAASKRNARVCEQFINVRSFDFDDKNGEWCRIVLEYPESSAKLLMMGIVEKICKDAVIHQVSGIGKAFLTRSETQAQARTIATEGVNLKAMWQQADVVDVDSIYTNDIVSVLRTYGVEAARNAIIQEIFAVFDVYGIGVNHRHLTLVADVMTRDGGYAPFNRMGIESNPSPLLKMSFETTCHFLTQATLYGDEDALSSPSSQIVTGKVSGVGTGSFDVFVPLDV